jgi:putative FmdB family regulatory protein
MPRYDYKCEEHGYFELKQSMKDHARGDCPTCGSECKQVVRTAPTLDIEAMARIGMPGAFEAVGDRITKRHLNAGQSYVNPDKAAHYAK